MGLVEVVQIRKSRQLLGWTRTLLILGMSKMHQSADDVGVKLIVHHYFLDLVQRQSPKNSHIAPLWQIGHRLQHLHPH